MIIALFKMPITGNAGSHTICLKNTKDKTTKNIRLAHQKTKVILSYRSFSLRNCTNLLSEKDSIRASAVIRTENKPAETVTRKLTFVSPRVFSNDQLFEYETKKITPTNKDIKVSYEKTSFLKP